MTLPSKELLSAVLNSTVHFTNQIKRADNELCISFTNKRFSGTKNYNIYELAHKVKEWAYSNGYEINSNWRGRITIWTTDFTPRFAYDALSEIVQTEPEAIFEAGDYILSTLSNK